MCSSFPTPIVDEKNSSTQDTQKSSPICPREETVKALADKLDKYRVVHARGPPGSGKTTLADFLASYYRGLGDQVIVATGWEEGIDPVQHLVSLGQQQGCHAIEHDSFETSNVVVISDEAQQTYKDLNLWLGLIKTQCGGSTGPRLCLFSLYGSPTTGRTEYPPEAAPVRFLPEQRVSITDTSPRLYYTRQEYTDAVRRRCSDPNHCPFDEEAKDYVWDITQGHPAATDALISYIFNVYRRKIEWEEIERITMRLIVDALWNDSEVFRMMISHPIYESFPTSWKVTPEAANVLMNVLFYHSIPWDLTNPGIRLCHEKGWLHAEELDPEGEEVVCVFPSRLHWKYVENCMSTGYRRFEYTKLPYFSYR